MDGKNAFCIYFFCFIYMRECNWNGWESGLAGLVARDLGATVIVSDQAEIVDLLETNIKLNSTHENEDSIQAMEFSWGTTPPKQMNLPFDYILVSDCT